MQGVGWDVRTVSDYITQMRIIDSNGDLREYKIEDDKDMLNAIQCNLGLWGIVVDFTLKVCKTKYTLNICSVHFERDLRFLKFGLTRHSKYLTAEHQQSWIQLHMHVSTMYREFALN